MTTKEGSTSIKDPELAALQILNEIEHVVRKILEPFKDETRKNIYHPRLARHVMSIETSFRFWLDDNREIFL